jgi:hypothetical protein
MPLDLKAGMSRSTAKPNPRLGLGHAPGQDSRQTPEESVSIVSAGTAGSFQRIDDQHRLALEADSSAAGFHGELDQLPADVSGDAIASRPTSAMQQHARELADQLETRRRDLDLREARLHRHLMLLDQERQAARLAFSEKEHLLESRLAQLAKREHELSEQWKRCAAAEEALNLEVNCARENLEATARANARDTELLHREQERLRAQSASLEVAERRRQGEREAEQAEVAAARQKLHLERRQFDQNASEVLKALEEKQAALAAASEELANERAAQAAANQAAIELEQQSLSRAEAEYRRLSAELESELKSLAKQRASHEEDCRNERRRLLLERESMQMELNRERSDLARRQQSLEDGRAAIQKAKSELADQQRAILEERLAVEQTYQALSRHDADASAEAVATARRKLAEQYRWVKESLQTQKSELLEIARQLDAREHLLAEDRDGLQQWVENQQAELDAQMIQIDAQRQQMQRREAEIRERELKWVTQKKAIEARLAIAQARAA